MSASRSRLLPIYSVDRSDNLVSLTFDAAWSADDTDDIIRLLDSYGVKATFFCVGTWVEAHPDAVKKLHDAGHEIMNHSDKHPHITNISEEKCTKHIQLGEMQETVLPVITIPSAIPRGI